MKKPATIALFVFLAFQTGLGQRKIIHLPDLQGYVTLKCDFHLHTVFSDGLVWPTIRIDEALDAGLDAIAITDHLEYSPHSDFIPVDHNAAWKICQNYAKERNLILVHGTEITRKMPPGHFNALFIKDASLLTADSVMDVFREAVAQGAFIQWNHPGWKAQQPDGIPRMYRIHEEMIAKGWLHGIEFYNDSDFYPLVFTMCRKNNLALMGNSDMHGLIADKYAGPGYINRPMTLVFARERSPEALREAMFSGRTMVWFRDTLAGREEFARPFFYGCISVGHPYYQDKDNIYLEIKNNSDIPFYLANGQGNAPEDLTLEANTVNRVVVSRKAAFPLVYDVKNILTGENEVLRVELQY